MFSYGERPYENTPAMDLPDLLERGIRLVQPSICSLDVFMLMESCEYLLLSVNRKCSIFSMQFCKVNHRV